MKNLKPDLFIGLLILMVSCDRPTCENTNSVFDIYAPETNEYKDELARQFQIMENKEVSYWFDKYETKDKKHYVQVFIQGEGLCAKGSILVKDWKKLENIKRTGGQGYKGAELRGLKVDIKKDSTGTEFIYKDIDYIVD